MTAAEAAEGAGSAGYLSIGAVLTRLRPEFPDLSVSKIRFLESEQLVTPTRTASGYRQFSAADVARLRYVLAAQRDHYLPLRVIKDQLDAIDRGLEPATPAPRLPRSLVAAQGPQPREFAASAEVRMTRDELLAESDLTAEQLAELEAFGLVTAGSGGFFDADAALAARTLGELLALGLEPRHLRPFRTAADREAALVAQLVSAQARQRDPDARQRASEAAASHAATVMRLHALLVKGALRRELGT
ncbi:MAG TPA: MerR family transcriptional regulator [Nakamurella sp.]|nr:MerR family transcriptional regulator [Nakamurella sp.]